MREVLVCGSAAGSGIVSWRIDSQTKRCISINTHLSTIPAAISVNVRQSRAMRKARMGVAAVWLTAMACVRRGGLANLCIWSDALPKQGGDGLKGGGRSISNYPDTRVFWWRHLGAITHHYSHRSILLGVSHTQLDSAHTSALLTVQHMTHRRFTLVSAFELKHKHQTDLCATSIVDNETKTMHATQLYKVNDRTNKTIVET
jgi:hypothetical protein